MRIVHSTVDSRLLFFVLSLMAIGLVMVFSTSSVTSLERYDDRFHIVKIQAAHMVLGTALMALLVRVDYRRLRRLALPGLVLTVVLLLLVFVPGIGRRINAAARWITLFGSFRIQPSEVAKLAIILYLADALARNYRKRDSFRDYLLPNLLLLALVSAIIVRQPNLSSAALVLGTGLAMIAVAHGRPSHIVSVGIVGIASVLSLAFAEPYRLRRIFAFIDPWKEPTGAGYHIIQSLQALGSGGLTGVGIGQSVQKMSYLPFVNTDFIFAVLGEETGMVGGLFLIALYVGILWRGTRIAFRAPDLFGMLLAFGITVGISLQAAVNMAVVSGLIPTTGIPLPLVSYGGSSMVCTLTSLGILLNISAAADKESLTRMARRLPPP